MPNKKTVIILSLTAFAIIAGAKLATTNFTDTEEKEGIIPLSEYIQLMEDKHGTDLTDGVEDAIDAFNQKIDIA